MGRKTQKQLKQHRKYVTLHKTCLTQSHEIDTLYNTDLVSKLLRQ